MDWLPSAPALAITCAVLLFICVVLAFVLWSTKHHRDPHIHVKCEAGIDALVPSLAALSDVQSGGKNLAGVADDDPVSKHFGDSGKRRREVHRTKDPHDRRRGKGVDKNTNRWRVTQIFRRRLSVRTVVSHPGAPSFEFAERIPRRNSIKFTRAKCALDLTVLGNQQHRTDVWSIDDGE